MYLSLVKCNFFEIEMNDEIVDLILDFEKTKSIEFDGWQRC